MAHACRQRRHGPANPRTPHGTGGVLQGRAQADRGGREVGTAVVETASGQHCDLGSFYELS